MSNEFRIFRAYVGVLKRSMIAPEDVGTSIPLPRIDEGRMIDLCQNSLKLIKDSKNIVAVGSPCYVIGNINGNIRDLLRILCHIERLDDNNFLFLGGYVNKGQFSLETITLILSLLCLYPDSVHLLRGSDEFESECVKGGFIEEIHQIYGEGTILVQLFMELFSWLPFIGIVNQHFFCVHSGISKHVNALKKVRDIPRPIVNLENNMIKDFVTAEYNDEISNFETSDKTKTTLYGKQAFDNFFKSTGTRRLIRSHNPTEECLYASGKGINIFSNSNYNSTMNKCSFCSITKENKLIGHELFPMEGLNREDAVFENDESRAVTDHNDEPLFFQTLRKDHEINNFYMEEKKEVKTPLRTPNCPDISNQFHIPYPRFFRVNAEAENANRLAAAQEGQFGY